MFMRELARGTPLSEFGARITPGAVTKLRRELLEQAVALQQQRAAASTKAGSNSEAVRKVLRVSIFSGDA